MNGDWEATAVSIEGLAIRMEMKGLELRFFIFLS